MFDGKIHYKLQFSIAMLNYQRVYRFWALMCANKYLLGGFNADEPLVQHATAVMGDYVILGWTKSKPQRQCVWPNSGWEERVGHGLQSSKPTSSAKLWASQASHIELFAARAVPKGQGMQSPRSFWKRPGGHQGQSLVHHAEIHPSGIMASRGNFVGQSCWLDPQSKPDRCRVVGIMFPEAMKKEIWMWIPTAPIQNVSWDASKQTWQWNVHHMQMF